MRTPNLAAMFVAGLVTACAGVAQAQDCKQLGLTQPTRPVVR
jgi:hypothetical protein